MKHKEIQAEAIRATAEGRIAIFKMEHRRWGHKLVRLATKPEQETFMKTATYSERNSSGLLTVEVQPVGQNHKPANLENPCVELVDGSLWRGEVTRETNFEIVRLNQITSCVNSNIAAPEWFNKATADAERIREDHRQRHEAKLERERENQVRCAAAAIAMRELVGDGIEHSSWEQKITLTPDAAEALLKLIDATASRQSPESASV
jgi:hypothetical protein